MYRYFHLLLFIILSCTGNLCAQEREVIKEGYTSIAKVGKKIISEYILLKEYEVLKAPLIIGDTIKDGYYKTFYNNNSGIKEEGRYFHDTKVNTWKYFDTGQNIFLEENYKDGIRDGAFVRYDCDGNPTISGTFRQGEKTGVWRYFSPINIQQKSMIYYNTQGKTDSAFAYYADGKLYTEKRVSYTSDTLKEYRIKSYDNTGILRWEETVDWREQGKFHSKNCYREDGSKYFSSIYHNDSLLISINFYDKNQQPLPSGDYMNGFGTVHYYYENGMKNKSEIYENYSKNGDATYFDIWEQAIAQVLFEDNRCIGVDCEKIKHHKDVSKNDFTKPTIANFGCGKSSNEVANFLSQNLRYPVYAQEHDISGTCYVAFIINEYGNIENPEIVHDIQGTFGEESIRVVNLMNKWYPSTYLGIPMRIKYSLPILFRLQ